MVYLNATNDYITVSRQKDCRGQDQPPIIVLPSGLFRIKSDEDMGVVLEMVDRDLPQTPTLE
jgi:hypothetical protein